MTNNNSNRFLFHSVRFGFNLNTYKIGIHFDVIHFFFFTITFYTGEGEGFTFTNNLYPHNIHYIILLISRTKSVIK